MIYFAHVIKVSDNLSRRVTNARNYIYTRDDDPSKLLKLLNVVTNNFTQ